MGDCSVNKGHCIIKGMKSWLMMFQMEMTTLLRFFWEIRDHSCYMQATNMFAFYPIPEVLEAEFKGDRLVIKDILK